MAHSDRSSMRHPLDIPTGETAGFLADHLAAGSLLIEIGCGEGRVAAALREIGLAVIGVDADPEALRGARARGVPVVRAEWPAFGRANARSSAPGGDDAAGAGPAAIAFTRSLHHVHRLDVAIRRCAEVLPPGGLVLVEDFDYHGADEATVGWFLELLRSPEVAEMLPPSPAGFVGGLLTATDPFQHWHRDHDHDLHSAAAMTGAMRQRFVLRTTARVPYLYRYVADALPATPEAARLTGQVLDAELAAGARDQITLIGTRLVAVRGNPEAFA